MKRGSPIDGLFTVGISHKSAPVAVREKLAVPSDERSVLYERLRAAGVREVVVVSTCNRVEVYGVAEDAQAGAEHVAESLAARVDGHDVRKHLSVRHGNAALHHVFRVSASLDSLVVGEPQILGQVKEAFEAAAAAEACTGMLARVMHRAFHVAKRVRTETALGAGQVSVASVAVDLAGKIYSNLNGHEVLLLGAGEIAESAARALKAAGASKILIANRSFERAETLARTIDGAEPRSLGELPMLLEHADVVLVSTGASSYVVTKAMAAAAVKRRRGRPLFFVDLAVPRNVEPSVHDLDNCYRYDIDDLEQIVSEGMTERQGEARAAEKLVEEELEAFGSWARQLSVTPTIVALRERVRQTLAAELDRSLAGKLKHLAADDRKALGTMLDAAVNKLLHAPTQVLRESHDAVEGAELVSAVRRLFDLQEDTHAETTSVDDAASPRH